MIHAKCTSEGAIVRWRNFSRFGKNCTRDPTHVRRRRRGILVPEVFLDFSPHERAAREPRSGEHELRSDEKEKPLKTSTSTIFSKKLCLSFQRFSFLAASQHVFTASRLSRSSLMRLKIKKNLRDQGNGKDDACQKGCNLSP